MLDWEREGAIGSTMAIVTAQATVDPRSNAAMVYRQFLRR